MIAARVASGSSAATSSSGQRTALLRDTVVDEDVTDVIREPWGTFGAGSPYFPTVTDDSEPSVPTTSPPRRGRVPAPQSSPCAPSMAESPLPGTELKSPAVTTAPSLIGSRREEQLHLAQEPASLRELHVRVRGIPVQVRGRHHDVPVRRRPT